MSEIRIYLKKIEYGRNREWAKVDFAVGFPSGESTILQESLTSLSPEQSIDDTVGIAANSLAERLGSVRNELEYLWPSKFD